MVVIFNWRLNHYYGLIKCCNWQIPRLSPLCESPPEGQPHSGWQVPIESRWICIWHELGWAPALEDCPPGTHDECVCRDYELTHWLGGRGTSLHAVIMLCSSIGTGGTRLARSLHAVIIHSHIGTAAEAHRWHIVYMPWSRSHPLARVARSWHKSTRRDYTLTHGHGWHTAGT